MAARDRVAVRCQVRVVMTPARHGRADTHAADCLTVSRPGARTGVASKATGLIVLWLFLCVAMTDVATMSVRAGAAPANPNS